MPRFRKKPVEVEARKVENGKLGQIQHWCNGDAIKERNGKWTGILIDETYEPMP